MGVSFVIVSPLEMTEDESIRQDVEEMVKRDVYTNLHAWSEAFEWKAPRRIKLKPGPRIPRKTKKYMKKFGEWKYTGKVNFTMEFYSTHEDWLSELTEEERTKYYNTFSKKGESSL